MLRYDLPMMDDMPVAEGDAAGFPRMLAIDEIDEDPAQPRQEFDDDALRELAATIAERGVRQPISVRKHPDVAGRWIVNFGARRLRASRLARKDTIPVFVDTPFDSYDQVVENEQREPLRPLELAMFIERRMAAGESQAEISRRLGKSRPYVTYAPDWLMNAYREGRCRGLRKLHDLRKLGDSKDIVAWAEGSDALTREGIAAFRATLVAPTDPSSTRVGEAKMKTIEKPSAASSPEMRSMALETLPSRKAVHSAMTSTFVLHAELNGADVEIVVLSQ